MLTPKTSPEILADRERVILKCVVDEFVNSGRPAASHRLKDQFRLDICSASIRGILHLLEARGLLTHTHVSSGRFPTDRGYRFYVDELMGVIAPSRRARGQMTQEIGRVARGVEELLQKTADSLARACHLYGFVLLTTTRNISLTEFHLLQVSANRILAVLEFGRTNMKSVILELQAELKPRLIPAIASAMRERILGLTAEEIVRSLGARIEDCKWKDEECVQALVEQAAKLFEPEGSIQAGAAHLDWLIERSGMEDPDRVRSVVEFLVRPENLKRLAGAESGRSPVASIGTEHHLRALQSCSTILSRIATRSGEVVVGIVGPTRMEYFKGHKAVAQSVGVLEDLLGE